MPLRFRALHLSEGGILGSQDSRREAVADLPEPGRVPVPDQRMDVVLIGRGRRLHAPGELLMWGCHVRAHCGMTLESPWSALQADAGKKHHMFNNLCRITR